METLKRPIIQEEYNEFLNRLFLDDPVKNGYNARTKGLYPRSITFQVTEACNAACKYCYQHNKKPNSMSFDVAKEFIDNLLQGNRYEKYIPKDSIGVILEFIGGEPFMEIDLIDKITDYFLDECLRLHHPWATRFKVSISSNGLLYFDPRVQNYIKKHNNRLSLSISIDGNKELHDSCRVDIYGDGTYDRAIAAVDHYVKTYNVADMPSKMTIAPGNVDKLSTAIISMIEHGYKGIHFNTVYEDTWTKEHALIYYNELCKLSDYIIDKDILYNEDGTLICAPLLPTFGQPIPPQDNQNYCGGTGSMLAIDWQGNIYPCIRYMPNAVGDKQEPYIIGTVKDGIMYNEKTCNRVNCLTCITRRSQSTDECFNCPIASGCGYCSGYNYEVFGTANKRTTFTCIMHKARILALSYLWNTYYRKHGFTKRYKLNIPDNWALEIITEEELNKLKELARE